MSKNIENILRAVGMSTRESKVYIAGLHIQSGPASEYAKATKLNRVTAYNTLEQLVQRGLFTKLQKQSGKHYSPISPDYLAEDARKNAESMERILPELRSLQGGSMRKPHVRFFQGWEGVQRIYEDTLTAQSEILNFAHSKVVRSCWKDYDTEYVQKRVEKGIYLRGITPDDAAGRKVHGLDTINLREILLIPTKDFDFTNEISIYDNKVAICSFESEPDVFGVIIESREVSKTQRQIFEMAWRYAKMIQ